jgi:hypothetical protein
LGKIASAEKPPTSTIIKLRVRGRRGEKRGEEKELECREDHAGMNERLEAAV